MRPHEAATTAYNDAAGEPTHVACLAMQFNTDVPTSEQNKTSPAWSPSHTKTPQPCLSSPHSLPHSPKHPHPLLSSPLLSFPFLSAQTSHNPKTPLLLRSSTNPNT